MHAGQASGLPPRKKLSKAKLRALEREQNGGRKSGKMRKMSTMNEEGSSHSRKRRLDDAGEGLSLSLFQTMLQTDKLYHCRA